MKTSLSSLHALVCPSIFAKDTSIIRNRWVSSPGACVPPDSLLSYLVLVANDVSPPPGAPKLCIVLTLLYTGASRVCVVSLWCVTGCLTDCPALLTLAHLRALSAPDRPRHQQNYCPGLSPGHLCLSVLLSHPHPASRCPQTDADRQEVAPVPLFSSHPKIFVSLPVWKHSWVSAGDTPHCLVQIPVSPAATEPGRRPNQPLSSPFCSVKVVAKVRVWHTGGLALLPFVLGCSQQVLSSIMFSAVLKMKKEKKGKTPFIHQSSDDVYHCW